MARRGGSSRAVHATKPRPSSVSLALLLAVGTSLSLPRLTAAGLYATSDQVTVLSPENVESVLLNSSAAFLVEFYATWCGHCVAFSPVWKSLARDIKEWKPAVDLAAIDCADQNNKMVCTGFGITGYPTLKFFPAYSSGDSKGEEFRGFPRDVRGLRQQLINSLEKHSRVWPPACPPLETTSEAEIDNFFQTNSVKHLALVFERKSSYVGREVTLDLLQYENIAVRRVLDTESSLVSRFGVTDFPSCFLISAGNVSRLKVHSEARAFYSYALQRLPGVVRAGKAPVPIDVLLKNDTLLEWRAFNRTGVYMSDLESALHYSLRVELSAHTSISGDDLSALKKYTSVLAKYFPGRPSVKSALKAVDDWLQNQDTQVQYRDFRDVLDNTVQTSDAVLPDAVRWVGCQGSQARFRGYPCSFWTLFHVLTVQAEEVGGSEPQEVLRAMRAYVLSFFGCRPCAAHFEGMASESLDHVTSLSSAVLWLWARHNRVNNRLAGDLSEDPHFPKIQWPSPDQCPSCHGVKSNGEHSWNQEEVLTFLRRYFSSTAILPDHLQAETQALIQQRNQLTAARMEKEAGRGEPRRARELEDPQEEDEEEPPALEAHRTPSSQEVPTNQAPRPKIVGLKARDHQEDIVDLDYFVRQHYKAKALRDASMAGVVRRRSLQEEAEDGWRLKPDLSGPLDQRWTSLLGVGFSRLDLSLCVLLYLTSAMCLLAMFLYVKLRVRLRKQTDVRFRENAYHPE